MSPVPDEILERAQNFPRVSGDEPAVVNLVNGLYEFSPRERG